MKRTAGAFMLLASLGGGCVSADRSQDGAGHFGRVGHARDISGLQGPYGQPIPIGHNGMAMMPSQLEQISYNHGAGHPTMDTGIMQAAGWVGVDSGAPRMPHKYHQPPQMYSQVPAFHPGSGILPVPAQGPPGAVATGGGALPPYMAQPMNARTSVRFADPAGMRITWYGQGGLNDIPLEAPARYNFAQGGIYRLKIGNIPAQPGLELYPTLEVLPATPKTATYLAHSSVPVSFTADDFLQVANGNFLVKVIYLPDPQYQELSTLAGPNEVVSTQLEPGTDPIQEAQKRGTILLIVRMGNIDLQAPNSPAMDAPNPFAMAPGPMPTPMMPGIVGTAPSGMPQGMGMGIPPGMGMPPGMGVPPGMMPAPMMGSGPMGMPLPPAPSTAAKTPTPEKTVPANPVNLTPPPPLPSKLETEPVIKPIPTNSKTNPVSTVPVPNGASNDGGIVLPPAPPKATPVSKPKDMAPSRPTTLPPLP